MGQLLNRATPRPSIGESPAKLVRSIVDITGERNFDEIRLSMVRTIFELLPARAITFFNISDYGTECRLNVLLNMVVDSGGTAHVHGLGERGLRPTSLQRQCLLSTESAQGLSEGRVIDCTPIVYGGRVIEIIQTELDGACDSAMLTALFRLYSNILDLIHDREMDTLTGVLNRRAFDNQLDGLIRQPKPAGPDEANRHWWLVMIDVDHFKQINDTYGHLIGDEVLILLARLMREQFRAIDSVYRYGGEEFAVILAPSTLVDARHAIERLREQIAGFRFPQVGSVTISAGMAALDRFDHVASVVGQADKALYHAKHSGRNQVCEYRALVSAGLLQDRASQHEVELF